MSNDCFGHPSFVTVKITDVPPAHIARVRLGGKRFRGVCFECSRAARTMVEPPRRRGAIVYLKTAPNSTTNPLTATALIYAFGAGITAGAGTRLVLQLILDIGWV